MPRNGRVAAASTPDAMSGAILSKLLVDRGSDVTAGQLLAEVDTAALARSGIVEARAELETAKRDATASVSLADEACVLADVAAKRSKRKQDLLGRGLASSEDAEQAKGDADAGDELVDGHRAVAVAVGTDGGGGPGGGGEEQQENRRCEHAAHAHAMHEPRGECQRGATATASRAEVRQSHQLGSSTRAISAV
jgi:multidrug efflux pump subunit AcrA (membrane-fusion protein)